MALRRPFHQEFHVLLVATVRDRIYPAPPAALFFLYPVPLRPLSPRYLARRYYAREHFSGEIRALRLFFFFFFLSSLAPPPRRPASHSVDFALIDVTALIKLSRDARPKEETGESRHRCAYIGRGSLARP